MGSALRIHNNKSTISRIMLFFAARIMKLHHRLHSVLLSLAFLAQIIPCGSFSTQNGVATSRDWTRPFETILDCHSKNGNPQRNSEPRLIQWNLPNLLESANDNADVDYRKHLQEVYSAAMAALKTQEGMTSLEYPSDEALPLIELEPVRRFLRSYSHDRGHDGRFGVVSNKTSSNKFSVPANLAFSMDRPLTYLRNILSYPPGASSNKSGFHRNTHEREEVIVFLPGPHTPLQPSTAGGMLGSGHQMQHLSQVLLEGMPMTLLQVKSHVMVDKQQHVTNEAVTVPLGPKLLKALESSGIIRKDSRADALDEDTMYRVRISDLDILRSCCSPAINDNEDEIITILVKLIDIAVESVRQDHSEEPHLVVLTCSTTAQIVATAIEEWKTMVTARVVSPSVIASDYARVESIKIAESEKLLQQAVTVVTMSALCRKFPDGPAYVHISMHDDPLVAKFGVTRKEAQGGGKDALILQTVSPYTPNTAGKDGQNTTMLYHTDAHNINACAIQFLSLALRINGVTSFRQLYHMGTRPTAKLDIEKSLYALNYDDTVGDLELPQDELLISSIKATGAERWLWNQHDDDDSPLPDFHTAEALIIEHLGYGVYEEIFEACCGGLPLHLHSTPTKV